MESFQEFKKKIGKKKVVLGVLLVFFFLKWFTAVPTFSDENIYFNMAEEMVENQLIPYKDFFFAHPPLQLFVLYSIFSLFGPRLLTAKLLPLASAVISVFLTYKLGEFLPSEKKLVPYIFLFSSPFLAFSSIGYGMWPAIALGLLSLYLAFKGRPFLSAISLTVAIFFRYLLLFYFPIILYFIQDKKKFIVYSLSVLGTFFLVSFIIFGPEFIQDTFLYHLKSKIKGAKRARFLKDYLFLNSGLVFLSFLLLYFKQDIRDYLELILIPIFIDILLLSIFQLGFYHYFLISLPFYILVISNFFKTRFKVEILVFLSILLLFGGSTIAYHNTLHQGLKATEQFFRGKSGSIWGDSIVVNYLSFYMDKEIKLGAMDLDPSRLKYDESIMNRIEQDPPKYLITTENTKGAFSSLLRKYTPVKRIESRPEIQIYREE